MDASQVIHPLVYEVHTRRWLRGFGVAPGGDSCKLGEVPEAAIARLAALGFTHLWLMGVWSIGKEPRRHACALAEQGELRPPGLRVPPSEVIGSPYAIHAYRVPPELGGEEGLARLRARLHAHGIGLILDFVPNHLSCDHPWIREFPSRFVTSPGPREGFFRVATSRGQLWVAHGRDPYFPPWTDTAQLDWRAPEVWSAMQAELEGVAARCDGVRVDMAMLLLPEVFRRQWGEEGSPHIRPGGSASEYWPGAIAAVKRRHPGLLLLAEAYWDLEARLAAQGFDYVYDKRFYDHLVGRRPSESLRHVTAEGAALWNQGARFLENHDEPRIGSLGSIAEQRAWAATLLSLPGLRLLHHGQLEGRSTYSDIRCLTDPPPPVDERPEVAEVYVRLLSEARRLGLGRGVAERIFPEAAWEGNPSHGGFVALLWHSRPGAPSVLCVANLADHRGQARLRLPRGTALERRGGDWCCSDCLGSGSVRHSAEELHEAGVVLDLGSLEVRWMELHPEPSEPSVTR